MAIEPKLQFEVKKIAKISKFTKISKVSLTHKFLFPWVIFIVKAEYDLGIEKKICNLTPELLRNERCHFPILSSWKNYFFEKIGRYLSIYWANTKTVKIWSFQRWRNFILKAFGAKTAPTASSTSIRYPENYIYYYI